MSRSRPKMPMLDSRRYWRIAQRKGKWFDSGVAEPNHPARRFEDACRSNESLDACMQGSE